MKKIILIIIIALAAIVVSVYIFIPSEIKISKVLTIAANDRNVSTYLSSNSKILKWWPEKTSISIQNQDTTLFYKTTPIKAERITYSTLLVNFNSQKEPLKSNINFIATGKSSTRITWKLSIKAGNNPFKRYQAYQEAILIKKQMDEIMPVFKKFMEDDPLVYDINLEFGRIKNTILLSQKTNSKTYPEMNDVYGMIAELKQYANQKNVQVTDSPMLNITQLEDKSYQVTTAVPLNKTIKPDGKYSLNTMVPGNVLISEVKGGRGKLNYTKNQIKKYMDDDRLISPAMPFEELITDRIAEPDTNKWISKFYYPIF